MGADLITRARSGDGEAFRTLTEPYRRELQVHCYRMLGSLQDAEDALQETFLAAWQGLAGYQERASVRTWLYRIATNRCLNARRSASRRQAGAWEGPKAELPEPTRLGEVVWLEPYPDVLLDDGRGMSPGPEARYEQTESISLAFVTALQALPPRQVAVLILRDVVGFHSDEVADMLDTTVDAVKSALKRARATLQRTESAEPSRASAPAPAPAGGSAVEEAIVAKFVHAYQSCDIDALVALLTDDVFISMPPQPLQYEGRDAAVRLLAATVGPHSYLVPTRANGQPAFGIYRPAPAGKRGGAELLVLTLSGDRISALTRFEDDLFPSFGLPESFPGAELVFQR
ncbi:sigma-70 family RNA polymerase sigma factor [Catenulispora sp. GAS73]|uniref:sigma-70 family RNA polymerase sigma factor n=1 Tax=Catenulispora sp. GAS73 TaxID=3156269 RepID=UPI00351909CF